MLGISGSDDLCPGCFSADIDTGNLGLTKMTRYKNVLPGPKHCASKFLNISLQFRVPDFVGAAPTQGIYATLQTSKNPCAWLAYVGKTAERFTPDTATGDFGFLRSSRIPSALKRS